jgi:hypothetical protein
MKNLPAALIVCSAYLLSGCNTGEYTTISYQNENAAFSKLPTLFFKGGKLPLTDPAFASYYVNGVLISLNFVQNGESYNFNYNFITYGTEAHCEIKSVSIDGLPVPVAPSTGDIKIGLIQPSSSMPWFQAHRSQGLHYGVGSLVERIKKDVLEDIVRRTGRINAVASVKVVNNGKTEERDIVYIFKRRSRVDF